MPRPSSRLAPCAACTLLLALVPAACSAIQSVAEAPGKMTKALLPGQAAPDKRPITDLHAELLRLADFSIQRVRVAAATFDTAVGTPDAHLQAVRWRLDMTGTIVQLATGPTPLLGVLDMLVAAKAGRLVVEDHLVPQVWGEPAGPLVDAFQDVEDFIWELLPEFFSEEQISALRDTLAAWEAEQAGKGQALREDLPTFREVTRAMSAGDEQSGGFLGFIELDPLAGLEPVAREVALTRQFAERLLFWSERLPMLLSDQTELATLEAQRLPEVVQVLADVGRVSKSVDSVAQTAAGLPDRLSAEREAALDQAGEEIAALRDSTLEQVSAELTAQREATLTQLSAEITAQREGLVRDLETAQEPLTTLLGESRATLLALESTSAELEALVVAVGTFLDRFESPEGEEPPEDTGPPARPFDITEYGDTATRLGQAAAELRQLVTTLDESLPQVEQMVDAAATRGDETIDHAFRRGLQLGLALIGAVAVAALAVRVLAARLLRKGS